ncbi:MAG: laccase domain-containing protein [Gemmatimonadetes bacterium]|nr:laccase domain-containing protein [Gemmatimonadota bacterium]
MQSGRDDRSMLDLRGARAARAAALGVDRAAISASPRCTACDARLHSFRRSASGVPRSLMLAYIGVSPAP